MELPPGGGSRPSDATQGIKVLIVDDDEDILDMASRYLVGRGFDVVTASSPFGVTTLISRERPAVVVLDVMMPALGGEALAALLTSLPVKPPVLFYSAMDERELIALTQASPADDCVSKTAGLDALAQAVRRTARRG